MIRVLKKRFGKVMLLLAAVFAVTVQWELTVSAAEVSAKSSAAADYLLKGISVSDNSIYENAKAGISVSDNSLPQEPDDHTGKGIGNDTGIVPDDVLTDSEATGQEVPDASAGNQQTEEAAESVGDECDAEETAALKDRQTDSGQLQTTNYREGVLTDWQQIMEALAGLTPQALTDTAADSPTVMLQLRNVTNIPVDVKDALAADDSGYIRLLHCNIGYGAALVFNGSADNSGFVGISDASVNVYHEKRGKRSMAVTVKFASHGNLGTVVSLHVNLPQCSEGTKVSVYAETVSVDANGNMTVGENVCIGNTKADANGNVEVPIQTAANYMFVYKAAKE